MKKPLSPEESYSFFGEDIFIEIFSYFDKGVLSGSRQSISIILFFSELLILLVFKSIMSFSESGVINSHSLFNSSL